jgi:outer membrane cobalamin receptor
MAGVVNVRTLERFQGTRISASGGSNDRFDASALTGVDDESVRAVFGLRGMHETGWRSHSGYDLGQAHARLVTNLSSTSTLDAGVELYGTQWDSPGFLSDSQFDAKLYNVVADPTDGGFKRRAQERVSLRAFPGDNVVWRTTVYATQGRWQLFLTTPPEPGSGEGTGSQTEEEDMRYGLGITSALTWALPRTELTLGTEGRWDHSTYENWLTASRVRSTAQAQVTARQASGALFLQSTTDLGHHFRLALGGRLDGLNAQSTPVGGAAISAGRSIISPKLGMLYHIPSFGVVYANVSRGFRQTDGVINDPTLPFISEWAYETGVKVDLQSVNASAALFRMDVSNEQTFDPITLTSASGGSSRRQGLDLSLEARLSDAVTVSGDWTLNDARYTAFVTAAGDTLNNARVFNTARYIGSGAVDVAPVGAGWHVRLSGNVVGPYTPFDEPGVERAAYGLVHVSGGVRVGETAIELGLRNLLDQAYPELAAGGFVSPGQPRSVFLTVQYRL